MANWLEAAFGLGDEAEPIAPPPRQAPEVKSFWCVVAQPTGAPGDFGETVDAWYFVERGCVTLCDANGRPSSGEDDRTPHSAALAPDDDPRAVAYRLRRRVWRSQERPFGGHRNERSAFDRPLRYRPLGIV